MGQELLPLRVVTFQGDEEHWMVGWHAQSAFHKLPAELLPTVRRPNEIYWVTRDFKSHPGLLGWGFFNAPTDECMLSAAAAIVTVPPASQRKYS